MIGPSTSAVLCPAIRLFLIYVAPPPKPQLPVGPTTPAPPLLLVMVTFVKVAKQGSIALTPLLRLMVELLISRVLALIALPIGAEFWTMSELVMVVTYYQTIVRINAATGTSTPRAIARDDRPRHGQCA